MSVTKRDRTWSWDSYLEWEARQDMRHELIDGEVYTKTGGTADHDTIATNLVAELRERLRGSPCRAHGANLKVKAGLNGRYPDALVDCGPHAGDALVAQQPTIVFEVLSKSTAAFDQSLKLRDYEAVNSIKAYVIVDQEKPRVLVYSRDRHGGLGSAASMVLVEGLDTMIELLVFELKIPLRAVYEDISF